MERHKSINPHPGSIFRHEIIEPLGLTIGNTASLLQVSRLTISKFVNGRGAITPNVALRIEKVFGGTADFWLRMQLGYDLHKAKADFEANPPELTRYENS